MGEFPRKSDGRRVFTVEFVRGCAKGPDGDSASRGGHPPDTADRAPDGLLCRAGPAVRAVTSSRATYGYRRVWAMVNRTFRASYNRKRVRRLMRMHGLMLPPRVYRRHGDRIWARCNSRPRTSAGARTSS